MIKRQGFVSNSSSSSFIVAYNPKFFGRLEESFQNENMGYDTNASIMDEEKLNKWYSVNPEEESEESIKFNQDIQDKVRKAWEEGLTVIEMNVEYTTDVGISILLRNIEEATKKNFNEAMIEVIYKSE